MKFVFDFGTIQLLIFIGIYVILTVVFMIIKKNEKIGLKIDKRIENDQIWHKVHKTAALSMIPFELIMIFLLFVPNILVKFVMNYVILALIIIIWNIIPTIICKKYLKAITKEEVREKKWYE